MTNVCSDDVRPPLAKKTTAEKRDTIFVLVMALIAAASFIWYFVKLALGDVEGAERLVPLVTILFFTSVGFDQKKETTSPGVHVLTNVNWVLMCAFAFTIIIPLLIK